MHFRSAEVLWARNVKQDSGRINERESTTYRSSESSLFTTSFDRQASQGIAEEKTLEAPHHYLRSRASFFGRVASLALGSGPWQNSNPCTFVSGHSSLHETAVKWYDVRGGVIMCRIIIVSLPCWRFLASWNEMPGLGLRVPRQVSGVQGVGR